MSKSDQVTVDLKALVEETLSGKKGFANTKKLRKLGYAEYSAQLEAQLAEKIARASNDPRRHKKG
jgi:hypothetical protein